MPPSPKSASKAAAPTGAERQRPLPRLNPAMACDTAFRIVAGRYLRDLTASHEATCTGDPGALHQMRIALTRLRTAILLFSPMVDDSRRAHVRAELKWLNGQLGTVRDLDVAMERLEAIDQQPSPAADYLRSWEDKRADSHRQLARALRSPRYRRLVQGISGWIEHGPWSIGKGKRGAEMRASPIAAYGTAKLREWRKKLLKESRKLPKMNAGKRHKLRLLNKKLSYSVESFDDLFADKRFSGQRAALKQLRKAQKSLGQLNDDANAHFLAAALHRDGVHPPLQFLRPKREKRLLKTASSAYRELAALKG